MTPKSRANQVLSWFFWTTLALCVLLTILFWKGLVPGRTILSNDAPLGAISAAAAELPSGFAAYWHDLNWLGVAGPSAPPDVSQLLGMLLGKQTFSKVFAPISVLFLGMCAFACFRMWHWPPAVCFAGGLAAALNSSFFCASAWGVSSQPIGIAFVFLALGALANEDGGHRWVQMVLAGFATGLAVMEAFDIGAIFSLLVALFVVYQAWMEAGSGMRRCLVGLTRVSLTAACAGLISASTLVTLVGTQVKGVSIQEQTGQEKWDYATQWSLPKRETLGILVPGLFGYRMDTPDGGNYWGLIGRHPAWERYYAGQGPRPSGGHRFSGGHPYAGVAVILIALWGVSQSFRRTSALSPKEKRWLWFWLTVAVVALLLSWGRFAPFYQFFYALPFASTIRNPAKFLHVFSFALVILFTYGVNVVFREYLAKPAAPTAGWSQQLKKWWVQTTPFERKWGYALATGLGLGVVAWMMYASSKGALIRYLTEVDFDAQSAAAIADFSTRQPGWFLLFFALTGAWLVTVLSGFCRGGRSRVAVALLGLLVAVDLARANTPWVVTFDWKERYASNPVLDFLRQEPHRQRVAILPFQPPPQLGLLHQLHALEWAQHHFLYYNIQSLDVVQLPRSPVDRELFEGALQPSADTNTWFRFTRRWTLTNTRYLLGPAVYVDYLNQMLDPGERRFRAAIRFDIVPRPGVTNPTKLEELTAVTRTEGPYAVIEFSGALPRAKLYDQWQVVTNDAAALEILASPMFRPEQILLLSTPATSPHAPASDLARNGKVDFISYSPKDLRLKADSPTESILLLNDRYDPNWKVEVDGRPAELLRVNFLMRGVRLSPGEHLVRFYFQPPLTSLYISLSAVAIGLALLVWLVLPRGPRLRPNAPTTTAG